MRKTREIALFLAIFAVSAAAAAAQNIIFTSLDGDRIDVEAHKGKVVVMAIGASWLPISDDQAATINKLAKKYSGRDDVIFYFIATDSASSKDKSFASDDDLLKFKARTKLAVSVLRDAGGQRSVERYNIDQLPAFIVLDKQGRPSGDPISGSDPFGKTDISQLVSKRVDSVL
ncbi:MAG: TlpA family protein disulfide reductase [Acidobacteriota bacterium]|nr:MAG: TlpA family protein disulfide reductase [Acidobacteriota bacterium]